MLKVKTASTAMVTGATSGIGLALARQLAAKNFNLVLIARDASALSRLAAELQATGIYVTVIVQDLSRPEAALLIKDELLIHDVAIDLLVNNAGFGVHGAFEETSLALEIDMARVQIDALLGLIKVVLPGMLTRGHGRILNLGSVYSFLPVPFQAVYSASKAFILSFSLALDNEVRGQGVTVTTLCPGITRTAFRRRSGKPDKNKGMSAEAVAAIGLKALFAGRRVAVPGIVNLLLVWVGRHLPLSMVPRLMRIINTGRGLIKKPVRH